MSAILYAYRLDWSWHASWSSRKQDQSALQPYEDKRKDEDRQNPKAKAQVNTIGVGTGNQDKEGQDNRNGQDRI